MSGGYIAVLAEPDAELEARLLEHARRTQADVVVAVDPRRRALRAVTRLALPSSRGVGDPFSGAYAIRSDLADRPLHDLPPGLRIERLPQEHPAAPVGLVALMRLALLDRENHRMLRFGMVGLTGAVVNLALLALLHERVRLHDLLAVPIAIEASIIWNHFWNDRLTFSDRRRSHYLMRLVRFNAVSIAALLGNFTVYAILTRGFGIHYITAEAIAIVVAFGLNYLGNFHWTYGADTPRFRPLARRAAPWLPFVLVVGAAAGFYFTDLDYVDGMTFDEHYYVSVAYQLRQGTWEDPCWIGDDVDHRPLNYEHPPLAKLIIAASVALFAETDASLPGCRDPDGGRDPANKVAYDEFQQTLRGEDPWIWRAPAALFGTATVAFVGLAAARLTGSRLAAFAGAALTLSDGTVFTASRMAILDIFATGFLAAAVLLATFPTRRGLIGSMVALALGFACKYSVAFAGPAVLALALWTRHRVRPVRPMLALRASVGYAAAAVGVWFLLYTPWLRMWIALGGIGYALRHLFDLTVHALRWQAAGQQTHAYISPPGEWLALRRPTLLFYDRAVGGDPEVQRHIYSVGNPALYWMAVAVFVFAWLPSLWLLVRPRGQRGDLRAWWAGLGRHGQAVAMASLLPATVYLAFFALTRSTYAFYMTLIAPLMAVAVAVAMGAAWLRRSEAWWVFPGIVLAISWFIHFLPVLRGDPIPAQEFQSIMANWPWMRA